MVPPFNEAAATDELVRLMNDGAARRALGHEAQEYALSEFGWPVVAEKYLEVYQRSRTAA